MAENSTLKANASAEWLIPVATVIGSTGLLSPAAGFANARVTGSHPTRVWVSTYSAQGAPAPAAFSLAVIC